MPAIPRGNSHAKGRIARARLALVLALVLAGCSDADEALRALDGVKRAACGCEDGDTACDTAAGAKLAAWHRAYDRTDGSAAQASRAKADLAAIGKCLTPPKP